MSTPDDSVPIEDVLLAIPTDVVIWTNVLGHHHLSVLQYDLLASVDMSMFT